MKPPKLIITGASISEITDISLSIMFRDGPAVSFMSWQDDFRWFFDSGILTFREGGYSYIKGVCMYCSQFPKTDESQS
jgi:hypothetical protein